MAYFDNAATTFPKPEEVYSYMDQFYRECGASAGRGHYSLSQNTAKMVAETNEHPGKLKDQVCSPGGTTIEAVQALETNGFRSAVMQAMTACAEKSQQMSKK